MRLARAGGIREILAPEQLGALATTPFPLHWQPAQLTRERTRSLWDYLRQEVHIEEITPEWVVAHLDEEFLCAAEDSWLIRFYAFLEQSPTLWRAARGRFEQPGIARSMPLIRLEDGSHVAPFDTDGKANAYLPGAAPSDYPTVRRAIADDRVARAFLIKLGLQEPDAVDEVLEKVLPRYGTGHGVAVDQNAHDVDLICRALRSASGQRRTHLVAKLASTAFLAARNAHTSAVSYREPTECYWHDDELAHYFQPCVDAWFLLDRYEKNRPELTELGVAPQVRITARSSNSIGHVILRNWHSDHSRGLHGFDPDLRIAGLDEALASPDPRRSEYVWNRLLAPYADRLQGTVESSSRQDYISGTSKHQATAAHRMATERAWLPSQDGTYAAPRHLLLDDLPPGFNRHAGLADALGMIKSVVEQASTELGIPLDLLIYLAGNPDALRAAEEGFRAAPTRSPASPESPRPMLDFTAELQIAFTKNTKNLPLEEEDGARGNGQVGAPDMRRERTAAIIKDALATLSSTWLNRAFPRAVICSPSMLGRPSPPDQNSAQSALPSACPTLSRPPPSNDDCWRCSARAGPRTRPLISALWTKLVTCSTYASNSAGARVSRPPPRQATYFWPDVSRASKPTTTGWCGVSRNGSPPPWIRGSPG